MCDLNNTKADLSRTPSILRELADLDVVGGRNHRSRPKLADMDVYGGGNHRSELELAYLEDGTISP